MKRRRFVQSLLTVPSAHAVLGAQQTTPQQQPPPQPNTPARQVPQQPPEVPKLALVEADVASETDQRFFTADQFAALEKLASTLMPAVKGNPGAIEARAAEFLDFLLGVSPSDRQALYRNGLDGLNEQALKQFQRSFSALTTTQLDGIIRPLLVARPWPQDLPSDPMQSFMAQVHEDLRTATQNSREWAEKAGSSVTGRRGRGFNRGVGYYWKPIDPVVRS